VVEAQDPGRELARSLLRNLNTLPQTKELLAYVEIDLGGPVSFGAHSYITDAFRLLGSRSVYEDERSEWLEPDLDFVMRRDPDLVVYEPKMYSKFGQPDLEAMINGRRWTGLRAVKKGNCYVTPGPLDFLAHHGPAFITEAMPWLSRTLSRAAEGLVP